MRMGKIRTPFFRIVVTDSRKARNGLSIEEIGRYVPGQEPSIMELTLIVRCTGSVSERNLLPL